jgi:tetratricopeptide (TPR) repeat protein
MTRALVLLAVWVGCASGAERWTRLTSPQFELYTTAGEKKGTETILYFEQVRSFFSHVVPATNKAGETPVRIVLFRSETQFKPYAPSEVAAAYYQPGRDRDYIVMGDSDPEHLHIAIHEYMHLIVQHSHLKLPLWMNEGLADVYSTLKPMGKKAMIGDLIPGDVQVLQNQKWMTFDALTQVDHQSQAYNEKNRAGTFYAESWALVHMLFLSPEYAPKFPAFLVAISSGKSAAEACQEAYGRSSAEVFKDLQMYFHRNRLFGATFNVSLSKSEEEAEASPIDALDSEIVLADILAASGKRDQANEAYRRLAAARPNDPDIPRAMGYLALQGNDREKTLEDFEAAFSKGGHDPQMCFDLALLEREKDRVSPKAVASLQRALEVKPDYLEARLELGLTQINMQKLSEALATLLAIKKVDGEHAPALFNALTFIYLRLQSPEEARKYANLALKWDRTEEDKRRTQDLLRYLNPAVDAPSPRSAPVNSDGERPALARREPAETVAEPLPGKPVEKVDRIEGTARDIDCAGKRLVIEAAGKSVSFEMPDPDKIFIRHQGAKVFDFTCGPQKPFPIAVEYVPAEREQPGIRGRVRTLEF